MIKHYWTDDEIETLRLIFLDPALKGNRKQAMIDRLPDRSYPASYEKAIALGFTVMAGRNILDRRAAVENAQAAEAKERDEIDQRLVRRSSVPLAERIPDFLAPLFERWGVA